MDTSSRIGTFGDQGHTLRCKSDDGTTEDSMTHGGEPEALCLRYCWPCTRKGAPVGLQLRPNDDKHHELVWNMEML